MSIKLLDHIFFRARVRVCVCLGTLTVAKIGLRLLLSFMGTSIDTGSLSSTL